MKLLKRSLEFRELDMEKRTATFVASTENAVLTPWGPEVLRMKGARLKRFRSNPVVLDTHDRGSITSVIGRATVKVDKASRQLLCTIEYAKNQRGEEAWDLVRGGFLRAVSIGYRVNEKRTVYLREGEADGIGEARVEGPALICNEWDLHEISNCAVPADHEALARSAYYGELTPMKKRDLYSSEHEDADHEEDTGAGERMAKKSRKKRKKKSSEDEDEREDDDDEDEDEDREAYDDDDDEGREDEGDDDREEDDDDEDREEDDDEDREDEEEEKAKRKKRKKSRSLPEEVKARRMAAIRAQVMEITPTSLRSFAEDYLLSEERPTLEGARKALMEERARQAKPVGTPSRDEGKAPKTTNHPGRELSAAEYLASLN